MNQKKWQKLTKVVQDIFILAQYKIDDYQNVVIKITLVHVLNK